VKNETPCWRRRVTASAMVGFGGIPVWIVKELQGITVPCPICGRRDTASIRWASRTWYTHCHHCHMEDRIAPITARRLVAERAPHEVDRLFEHVPEHQGPLVFKFSDPQPSRSPEDRG
jgi:hypothetical protein